MASHFGQAAMVRFLLRSGAAVDSSTNAGYTPLHQAAQQGHTLVINLLLESKAKPNAVTNVSFILSRFKILCIECIELLDYYIQLYIDIKYFLYRMDRLLWILHKNSVT